MASTMAQSMDQISSNTYLELISQLTSFSVAANSDSVKNVLKSNIQSIYKKVSQNNEFQELFELIKESFPSLAKCPNASNDLSSEKLAELFVEWNLFFLDLYYLSLTKAMRKYRRHVRKNDFGSIGVDPPDTLNSNQRKAISFSIDFVFAFAISMQLLPGVGMALNFRSVEHLSGFSKSVKSMNVGFMRMSLNAMIDLFESKFTVIFKEYITSHHFNTYLSAIFQIAYCPNYLMKGCAGKYHSSDQKIAEYDMKTEEEIRRYKEYLSDLIHLSPQKFIFRELMMLIGGCSNTTASCQERQSKTPKWLMRSSSHYVRECIMKEDGVKSLILSLSDETLDDQVFEGGKPANVNWNKCCMVARIITNCPLYNCSEVEYSSTILKQIFEIIRSLYYKEEGSEGKKITARPQSCKSMVPILVKVMETFSASQPTSFVDHILRKVAGPLFICSSSSLEFCQTMSKEMSTHEVVSAQDFSLCIETLHEIVVIFHYPQSTLSSSLVPFLGVLFRLHMFSTANPTYLSFSIESLINHIFDNMELSQVVLILKQLSGLETDESLVCLSSSLNLCSLLSMNENLEFAPGESGGIRVVLNECFKRTLGHGELLEEIEKKVACLVNIISLIRDQEVVAREIFLACLQKLTFIVSQEIDTENDVLSSIILTRNFDVNKWETNILLLTLLSGLVEKFDDLCVSNIGHIFLFSQATMEHSIQVLKKPRSRLTCVTSVDDFQMETLALVIGLLATVIFDSDQISCNTLLEAEKLVSSLRYLSVHHSSSDVRSSACELVTIITHQTLENAVNKRFHACSSILNLESKYSKESCFGRSTTSQGVSSYGTSRKPKTSSSLMSSLGFIVRSPTDQETGKTISVESLSTLTPIIKTQKGSASRSTLMDSLSSDHGENYVSNPSSTSLKANAESKKFCFPSGMGEPKLSSIGSRNQKSVHFSHTVHTNEIQTKQKPSQVSNDSSITNNMSYCDEVNTLLKTWGKLSYNN